MGTLASQGFQPSMRAILGFVFWRPGGIGVCVSGCVSALVSARVRWNAALECGRGHRRGLPALGVMAAASFVWCWVALRPTSGRGRTNRAPGRRGPGKEDAVGILFLPGFLPQVFSFQPGFRRPGAAAREAAFPEWKVL